MTEQQKLNDGATAGMASATTGKWPYRRIVGYSLALVLVVGLFFAGRWFFTCPCDTTPGAVLWGEVVEEPVSDWSFANEVERPVVSNRFLHLNPLSLRARQTGSF